MPPRSVFCAQPSRRYSPCGGQIVALDRQGRTRRVVVPIGGMFPPEGMAEAPSDFGSYGGQVFTVNQGGVDYPGTDADSHIGRIDPATGQVSRFCDLPRIEPNVTSGWPSQGTFGPPGSPFAGKFYAAAAHSHTVYQVTPDAKCVPFATFANFSPAFIAFTPDGKTMIVSGFVGEAYSRNGALMRVSPTGSIDPEPLLEMPGLIGPLARVPKGFGPYGGQWFFCLRGRKVPYPPPTATARPLAQPLPGDEVIYRWQPGSAPEVFASGFRNRVLTFLDEKTLWVSDEGKQFYQREIPDGSLIEIRSR